MQLSMWTLADNLAELKPQVQAQRGTCQLRNARLLTEASEITRSTLYLQQNERNTVFCMNGNDVMVVRSDDAELVLNTILDVFDHLNEWEAGIDTLIRNGSPLETILHLAAEQLGMHLIVADATYYIREFAPCPNIPFVALWNNLIARRSMELESILEIDANPIVRRADAGIYFVALPDEDIECAVGNLFTDSSHKGWVIGLRADGRFSQGDFDLLQVVVHKVEDWLRVNASLDVYMEQTGVFTRLLDGQELSPAEAERALATFAWRDGDDLEVIVAQRVDREGKPSNVAARFMRQAKPNSFAIAYGDGLVLVSNESLETRKGPEELSRVLKICGYTAGTSATFHDIMQLKQHYEAALIAAASGKVGEVTDFESVKLPYALSLVNEHAVASVSHRALAQLEAYDDAHGTQLLETLKSFVMNRGSYVATYEELIIHRSTLAYRLERIVELTGVDLDDRDTWNHLALSFMLP